jgi:glycosyltransferase involved in cell wall biosynthesis
MRERPVDRDTVNLLGPWPPPTGGVATHVRQLRDDLSDRGVRVRVLGYGAGPMGSDVTPLRFDSRVRFVHRFLTAIPWRGILHGHSWITSHPDFTALRGYVWLIRAKGLCWIESVHSGSLPERYAAWQRTEQAAYPRLLGRAHRLVAASEPLRDFLVDIGIDGSRIVTVGPLLPAGLRVRPAELEVRASEFAGRHDPLIVAIGAMLPLHDFVTVASCFLELRRRYPGAGLALVSTGAAIDDAHRSSVETAVGGLDEVLYLDDLPHTQLLALMRRASVVVRGPATESYGLSRVEAMIMGTPVVATATGERQFIIPYEFGDPASLRRAIDVALSGEGTDVGEAIDYFTALAEANLDAIVETYRSCRASGFSTDA